ncbi:MAG: hypothetical protein MJ177_07145 [Clostridia bacterium]|nr:hypothetical protein [Clostridia bacterium]
MKIKSIIAMLSAMLILMSCLCACGEKITDATTQAAEETTQAAEETTQAAEETTQAAEKTTQAAEETTQAAEKTTQVADTTTQAVQEAIPVELPTNSGGTLESSNLVVTDITAYDRKSNGDLVRETKKDKLKIKKSTIEKNGENVEAYVGTYTVSGDADVVFFSLECSLNTISEIALGREFKRADGSTVFESKYRDEKNNVYPLIINVKF